MRRVLLLGLAFSLFTIVPARARDGLQDQKPLSPQVTHEEAVLIAESYNLWKTLGDKLWPGWTRTPAPMLYITQDYEYAIDFPESTAGFQPIESGVWPGKRVQTRKRVLEPNLSASFDIEGINAVVIGRPSAIGKRDAEWALTAIHEMFHVWQMSKDASRKIAALKIGPDRDASWQLNFPFPYTDADVLRLIHLQSYLVYLAATSEDKDDAKYSAGTAREGIEVYRRFLKSQDATEKLYSYSKFQEWVEGIAFYTEYKMAELAASASYQPTEAFRKLYGAAAYRQLWDKTYKNRLFLVKHAGRTARSRTVFYHLGMGKGLLLDRLMPDWKAGYFDLDTWLDDLIVLALSKSD